MLSFHLKELYSDLNVATIRASIDMRRCCLFLVLLFSQAFTVSYDVTTRFRSHQVTDTK